MKLYTASNRSLSRRSAFTLVEILVVVAIIVILATVASVAVTANLESAKKSKAQLQATAIAKAMEIYYLNTNSGSQYPASVTELITPPWGGPSLLNDPTHDLTDPWGGQFQIQQAPSNDGSILGKPIVFTRSPDGVNISQHGVGPLSRLQ